MTLDEIADRLYALEPAEFTAARDQAAKQHREHAREIKALRRPTAGAAVVNALARSEPELLDQLLALGPALAKAQQDGDGVALRQLGDRRRQLIEAVVQQAAGATDRPVTAAARGEVASTLEAGLVDTAAADAVRSGRLVRPLAFAGFGGVDLADAVALPSRSARRAPKQPTPPEPGPGPAQLAAAESAALEAAGALDDAVRHHAATVDAQEQAVHQWGRARAVLLDLQERLAQSEREVVAAEKRVVGEQERRDRADAALADAQSSAETARAALDALLRPG